MTDEEIVSLKLLKKTGYILENLLIQAMDQFERMQQAIADLREGEE